MYKLIILFHNFSNLCHSFVNHCIKELILIQKSIFVKKIKYLKSLVCHFIILLFVACKPVYNSEDYNKNKVPPSPNYSENKSWAVLPNKWPNALKEIVGEPSKKEADVFYIYPTLFIDKKNAAWNSDITLNEIRKEVIEKAVKHQASAWTKAGNLYVPFYRQAHYRIFIDEYVNQGKGAGVLAYQDVKNAFIYFLKNYNYGKPIIIAAHSQGSIHAKRLIHEFFDGKDLQEKLIAAYLIGVKVKSDEFKSIKSLKKPEATGGFVSWNTYKINKLPKRYEKWYKGGVATNPISWTEAEYGDSENHLGVLASDFKIYPKSLSVQRIDGMIWSTLPKIPKRFSLSFIKNYHFADVNLFWADIQNNSILRTQAWLKKNQYKTK